MAFLPNKFPLNMTAEKFSNCLTSDMQPGFEGKSSY